MLTKEMCLCTFHKQIFEEKAFTGVLQARKSYLQVAFAIQCSGTTAVKKEQAVGARTLGGLSQNNKGMLARPFACFSTALLTLVVHI